MSEDLFVNPHSTIPDALWKASSPMERQLAAVEFWHNTTKTAAAPTTTARVRKLLAHPNARERLMAGITGTAGAAGSLISTRGTNAGKPVDVGGGRTSDRPTAEQMDLRVDRAALDERNAQGRGGSISNAKQDIRERLAQLRAENKMLSAAVTGLLTGGAAYGYARFRKGS